MVAAAVAFLRSSASKSPTVHLVCLIIMYTIYEMYKDLALLALRMVSFSNAEAAGDVKRSARGGSINTSRNGYSATYRTRV